MAAAIAWEKDSGMSDMDRNGTTGMRLARGAAAGLVAGVVASFVMEAAQALIGKLSSSEASSDEEPATVKAANRVSKAVTNHDVSEDDRPFAGEIVHYVVGAGLGIAYGIAAEFRPQVTSGYGAGFAVATAGLLDESAVPAAGLGNVPWDTPLTTHLYSLASHLVFGVAAEVTRRQVSAALQPH